MQQAFPIQMQQVKGNAMYADFFKGRKIRPFEI